MKFSETRNPCVIGREKWKTARRIRAGECEWSILNFPQIIENDRVAFSYTVNLHRRGKNPCVWRAGVGRARGRDISGRDTMQGLGGLVNRREIFRSIFLFHLFPSLRFCFSRTRVVSMRRRA